MYRNDARVGFDQNIRLKFDFEREVFFNEFHFYMESSTDISREIINKHLP